MSKYVLLIVSITFLASCSSPKYVYYFDHYDYNSGRKNISVEPSSRTASNSVDENPLSLNPSLLTASTAKRIGPTAKTADPVVAKNTASVSSSASAKEAIKKYKEMSKTQRKEFRQAMREDLKKYVIPKKTDNSVNTVAATEALDHDLKLAIIFGAVGLTLSLFGGITSAFWVLSVISIVVGVVFLIKWLSRQ